MSTEPAISNFFPIHGSKKAGLNFASPAFSILFSITLSFCFFIPAAVFFYKPAIRSVFPGLRPCRTSPGKGYRRSSRCLSNRQHRMPPSSVNLLPVILACSCLSSLFTFRNILFHQAVQCAFHLYHNVHQPVVLFAKPLVFFFQSIFAMSLHAHCFRPPYASSAAALSCVHFLLLKYIIHFPAIEKWFLNASFDTVRRTHDMHGQSSAPQDSCCPQTADLVQQRNQYKKAAVPPKKSKTAARFSLI